MLKFNSKGRKSLLLTSHNGRSTGQAELKQRLQHGERRHGARLQVLQDGLRRGPPPRVGVAARQAQQQQPLGLLLVVRAAQAQVDGLQHAPGTVEPPHPLQQLAAPGRVAAGDAAAADDLQDHGAEAEDVRLAGGAPRVEALGRDVPQGARHADLVGVGGLVGLERARQAEVAEPGVVRGVEHDVGRLDVAVDHRLVELVVEVVERRRHAGHHRVALPPVQRRGVLAAEEVPVQAAVGHVVVHQQQHAVVMAPACGIQNPLCQLSVSLFHFTS